MRTRRGAHLAVEYSSHLPKQANLGFVARRGLHFEGREEDPQHMSTWPKKESTVRRAGRLEEALPVARKMLEVAPRDLRPYFYMGEILAMTGAGAKALEQMDAAKDKAIALAHDESPAPKELVAAWLLRIAYTFCGPMESVEKGALILEQALTYDPNALVGHQLAPGLEECKQLAK